MTIMSKRPLLTTIATIAVFFTMSLVAIGQEITGNIVGTVRDANGAAIAGATIKINDEGTGLTVRSVTSNSEGEFSAPNIPVSSYVVVVEAPNFKRSQQTGVKVDVGQRRTVDVVLEAGRIEEVVTVQADAVAIDTASPQSSTTINGDQVREISINNRNFIQLVTLAPGVSNDLTDFVTAGTTTPETGTVNTVQISVNGARSSQNTFTVDGADVTDRGSNLTIQAYPSIDSIGEFRVLRSLYPAESGRSGGGQVNVVTRPGTSKFRGNLFEFVRNERLNANDFLSNQTPGLAVTLGRECEDGTISFNTADSQCKLRRRPFRYNNFGWTFGGPVILPNFGERNPDEPFFKKHKKTFFFFSQEFRRDTRSPVFQSTVPNALLRQGIFNVPICVQATGTTCTTILNGSAATPLSITTLRPISPVAQQYIDLVYNKLPLPNVSPTSFTLNSPIQSTLNFRQEILKLDHSFSDKASMFYRFQQDTIPSIDGNAIFGSGSNLPGVSTLRTQSPGKTHTFQFSYAQSSNFIWTARYTYGWGAIKNENIGSLSLSNSPITPPLAYPRTRDRIPSLSGNGFSGLVGQGQYDNFSNKGNIGGDVTWLIGRHALKAGLLYSKYRKNENAIAGNNEGLFDTFITPGGTASVVPTGGNATQQLWANFLLGTNLRFTQASFDYTADLRQSAFEAFVQDEWKAFRNVTLSYGVRYSYFGPPYDKNGRLTNFVPELWRASAAPLVTGAGNRVSGSGNYCNGIIANAGTVPNFPNCTTTASPWGKDIMQVSKRDFAPRVGLAWDPFGKGETSIRTGYGIYHEQVLNGMILQIIGQNIPYQQNCQVTGATLVNPAAGCNPASPNFADTVPNLRAIDPDWKTPYMQHWSFDVQQQLTRTTVVTAGYYGSKGTHLIGGFEMNLVPPGAAIARGTTGCATGASTTPTVPCQVSGQAFYTTAQSAILDQIRPFRGYRSITMVQPRYNSDYHSLQVSGQQRFSGASQVNIAYTWAKNLTDAQNDRSTSPQNTYNIRLEKGRAALDRRHIFTANYIYELPFYSNQKGFVGKMLGGWQFSGLATYQTGLPFTPTISSAISGTLFDPSGLGIIPPPLTVGRPNILCNPNQGGAQTAQQWFNTACFQATPTSGTVSNNDVGNGGRGIVLGPSTKRVDITLSKNIRFGERFRIQLRGEGFNVFNFVNFRGLNTSVWNPSNIPTAFGGACTSGCSTFGSVTSVRDPRVIQLGAKFYF